MNKAENGINGTGARPITNGKQDNWPFPEVESLTFGADEIKIYKFRWVILTLFIANSMCSSFQWIQFSIINNIVTQYYGVTSLFIDWTSMVYMVTYIPLIIPASWFLDRYGLRKTTLLGSFGTALGAAIKCFSVRHDLFAVTFVGQTVCAISQIFILNVPPRLAAVWFGPSEVSTACAIGVFGNQLGIALGFLLPPEIVPSSDNKDVVATGLAGMYYGMAAFTGVLFIICLFLFRAAPPLPPSKAAAAAQKDNEGYSKSLIRLARNRNYVILLIAYGINVGVCYAISTLLNQVLLVYFPGRETDAGRIGLVIVVSGMVGSLLFGFWLDRSHKFQETALAVYILSFIGMLGYTFNFLSVQIWVVYLVAAFLGFFMTGYLALGFEYAAEITYPEPEGTSSGLLNASAQVFGIVFTMAAGALLNNWNDKVANLTLSVALLVGVVLSAFIKGEYRRLSAQSGNEMTGIRL